MNVSLHEMTDTQLKAELVELNDRLHLLRSKPSDYYAHHEEPIANTIASLKYQIAKVEAEIKGRYSCGELFHICKGRN